MARIIQGDALEQLKTLEAESIDCCICSPPYWALRDYGTAIWEGGSDHCPHKYEKSMPSQKSTVGQRSNRQYHHAYKDVCGLCGAKRIDQQLGLESTFTEYIDKLCNVFDEVKRVLKKTGSCWVVIGDTYAGGDRASSGADIKNLEPKYLNKTKPNYAPNRMGCGLPDKSLIQIPARFSIEMSNRGWLLRNTIIWTKPNCMPTSAKDRFTVDFEYLFFFTKNKKYYFKQQFEPLKRVTIERYARGVSGKHKYKKGVSGQTKQGIFRERRHTEHDERGANKRCVWTISTKSFKEAHFAVFPEKLLETPIKATLPPNGVLLDPFFGSGTTAAAQKRWQPSAKTIGIELNSEYIKIAEKRLAQEVLPLA